MTMTVNSTPQHRAWRTMILGVTMCIAAALMLARMQRDMPVGTLSVIAAVSVAIGAAAALAYLPIPLFWVRNGWTIGHAAAGIVLPALAIVLTWDAWVDISTIAVKDEEASHIFLVPIVVAWLIWARRERFRNCLPTGQWIGVAMVVVGWALASYGYSHDESPWAIVMKPLVGAGLFVTQTLLKVVSFGYISKDLMKHLETPILSFWHAGSVMVVLGSFFAVVGKDVLLRFIPAWAVLVFLVPIPGEIRQAIAQPLQSRLAEITSFIFHVAGSDIIQDGNRLSINGVEVAIAEACNGLRMVFALALVSYLFAFATPLRNYVRFIIVAASPLSALLCNVIRMIPTVYLYGLSRDPILGMDGTLVAQKFHDYAGWVMLVVAFLLLMGVIKVLRWALVPVTPYTLAYD